MDAKVDLVANDRVCRDADLREESVAPVALHSLGDLGAWHFHLLSDRETGESCEHIVFIAFDTLHGNAANLTGTRGTGIGDVGVDDLVLRNDA